MGKWQDIATAPKDGTPILVCYSDGTIRMAAREAGSSTPKDGMGPFDGYDFCTHLYRYPTHWMPLPEPPERPR